MGDSPKIRFIPDGDIGLVDIDAQKRITLKPLGEFMKTSDGADLTFLSKQETSEGDIIYIYGDSNMRIWQFNPRLGDFTLSVAHYPSPWECLVSWWRSS